MRNEVDLHMHTTASDGTQLPEDNVRMAKAAGLYGIAITDHDTVAGVANAILAGEALGIHVIPGVEISTVENGLDIHILGYYIDRTDSLFLNRLQQLRDGRESRNLKIVEKLNALGIAITMDEVIAQAGKGVQPDESIGRPHIAEALLNKGYVGSIAEAFDRYLGRNGAAHAHSHRVTSFEAVDWIREAGGVAVVAHPGLYGNDSLVERIVQYGASGIEAYHSDHSPEEEERYAAMAERLGCLVTAGSDFHGERGGHEFHAPIGSRRIGADVLERLQACRTREQQQ
ncbi:PHP domain-containing protein [Paenibacillus koleovorans]|uniref:PHP domain-containing protein n=1 Tax=Paenibacillus koleovorans TaxID=121608 RepID=UPI000FD852CC|nr:PHP domain-containing protein [Paenibacillus koleovorans]